MQKFKRQIQTFYTVTKEGVYCEGVIVRLETSCMPFISQHYGTSFGPAHDFRHHKSMREYISRAAVQPAEGEKGTIANARGQHGQTSRPKRTPGHAVRPTTPVLPPLVGSVSDNIA